VVRVEALKCFEPALLSVRDGRRCRLDILLQSDIEGHDAGPLGYGGCRADAERTVGDGSVKAAG